MTTAIGPLLKEWRAHRRLSQLDLAAAAGVSQRHISFVETGRSRPSRELVVHLAETMSVPLRDRNVLLQAAGFAPLYRETAIDDPDVALVQRAVELMLDRHEPYPAVVLDHRWNLIRSNSAAARLTDEWAGEQAVAAARGNMLRLMLHPEGFRRHAVNFDEVAVSTLVRLHRDLIAHPQDPELRALVQEVMDDPSIPHEARTPSPETRPRFVVAIHLDDGRRSVRMFSTLATVGAPIDITLQEMVIELFFPADDASEQYFRSRA